VIPGAVITTIRDVLNTSQPHQGDFHPAAGDKKTSNHPQHPKDVVAVMGTTATVMGYLPWEMSLELS
jgi:hypothetical protein